jgi:hypothetical protein
MVIPVIGIVSGIVALCGIARHGKDGILGSAITGLVIYALLIASLIPNFQMSYVRPITRRERMAMAQASIVLYDQFGGPEQDFQAQSKTLREGKVMDFTAVTERSQLAGRRALVLEFLAAYDRIKDLGASSDKLYRAELLKQGLTGEAVDSILSRVNRSASILAIRIREQDSIMARDMLGLIKLMDETWGLWKVPPDKQSILFDRDADRESYQLLLQNIDRSRETQRGFQKRLEQIQRPIDDPVAGVCGAIDSYTVHGSDRPYQGRDRNNRWTRSLRDVRGLSPHQSFLAWRLDIAGSRPSPTRSGCGRPRSQ